jgi:hypothetical protein
MAKKAVEVRGTSLTDDNKVLLSTHVDTDTAKLIDDYRWSNRIEGRAETVRQLIIKGLSGAA